jgi:hypothetical protein
MGSEINSEGKVYFMTWLLMMRADEGRPLNYPLKKSENSAGLFSLIVRR